mmetsp:Transcript_21883/g.52915  ORF Transcript_21883/g.52915 Transcript_21883/m.52915 type:complete len:251 (+) Transcript_21883:525-1277(+)
MGLEERLPVGIEREPVHAAPQRQHQHGRGRVQAVPRRHEVRPALQEAVHAVPIAPRADPTIRRTIDPEYRSHRQARIDVLAAVDGIEHCHVLSALERPAHGIGGRRGRVVPHDVGAAPRERLLLARHGAHRAVRRAAERTEHERIAKDVELLLNFPLDVDVGGQSGDGIDRRAVEIVRLRPLDDAIDLLARVGDCQEGTVEGADGRELPAFDLEEALEGAQVLLFHGRSGRRGGGERVESIPAASLVIQG